MTSSHRHELDEHLAARILVLDGAMGTMLQTFGLDEAGFRGQRFDGHSRPLRGNYDLLSLTRPDLVSRVHHEYLAAGSDIITTNTFNATSIMQAEHGLAAIAYELNVASARLARAACDAWTARKPRVPRWVAGAVGPTGASSPPGVHPAACGAITADDLTRAYTEQVRGLVDGGCDLLLIETVFDVASARAAIVALDEVCDEGRPRLPLMISATISGRSGLMRSGHDVHALWCAVADASPWAVGLNCSEGAQSMGPHLESLARVATCAVSCHPSAGLPDARGEYPEGPDQIAAIVADFASRGLVNIVGGCCGTTPRHIEAIATAIRDASPRSWRPPA
jgi:5-methyltetrahydrofolate--homocysteine methyltransferase